MYETIRSALFAIPPDDREVWFRMASALKRELGERDGFELWDEWSRQWKDYRVSSVRGTWRSAAREAGPRQVTLGSLFYIARQWGWSGEVRSGGRVSAERRERAENARRRGREQTVLGQRRAASQAAAMVEAATMSMHSYLESKGLGDVHMPVLGKNLLVPMRDAQTGALWSAQLIAPDGVKRFLSGGRAAGLMYGVARGTGARWFCEGLSTALSVHAAVRAIGRLDDAVVACFAAANVEAVSSKVGRPGDLVVADRDGFRCGTRECSVSWDGEWEESPQCPECGSRWVVLPAGERYARRTDLRFWLPERTGDANDMMARDGIDALAAELERFAAA